MVDELLRGGTLLFALTLLLFGCGRSKPASPAATPQPAPVEKPAPSTATVRPPTAAPPPAAPRQGNHEPDEEARALAAKQKRADALFAPGAAASLPHPDDDEDDEAFGIWDYCRDSCPWVSGDEKQILCMTERVCEGCMACEIQLRKAGGGVLKEWVVDYQEASKTLPSIRKVLRAGFFRAPPQLKLEVAKVQGRTLTVRHGGLTHTRTLRRFRANELADWSDHGEEVEMIFDPPANWAQMRKWPVSRRLKACCRHTVLAVRWLPQTWRVLIEMNSSCQVSPSHTPPECFDPYYNHEMHPPYGFELLEYALDDEVKQPPLLRWKAQPSPGPSGKAAPPAARRPSRPSSRASRATARPRPRPTRPSRPTRPGR